MFFNLIIERVKCFRFFFFRKPLTPPSVYLQNFCQTCKLAQQLFHRNSSQLILSYLLSQSYAHQIRKIQKKIFEGTYFKYQKGHPSRPTAKIMDICQPKRILGYIEKSSKKWKKKNYVDGRICRNCYSTGLMCKVICSK